MVLSCGQSIQLSFAVSVFLTFFGPSENWAVSWRTWAPSLASVVFQHRHDFQVAHTPGICGFPWVICWCGHFRVPRCQSSVSHKAEERRWFWNKKSNLPSSVRIVDLGWHWSTLLQAVSARARGQKCLTRQGLWRGVYNSQDIFLSLPGDWKGLSRWGVKTGLKCPYMMDECCLLAIYPCRPTASCGWISRHQTHQSLEAHICPLQGEKGGKKNVTVNFLLTDCKVSPHAQCRRKATSACWESGVTPWANHRVEKRYRLFSITTNTAKLFLELLLSYVWENINMKNTKAGAC